MVGEGAFEAEEGGGGRRFPAEVDVACSEGSYRLVDGDEGEGGDHPAPEFVPVAPAGANVQDGDDPVGDFEEFVAGPADDGLEAEDGEEEDEDHGDAAEDHVLLFDPFFCDGGLGLVEFDFDDGPADGVEGGLCEDDATEPAVEEVEVLVWDAGDEAQHAFSHAEEDGEGSEGIRERSDAIAPGSEGGASVEEICAFDGSVPYLIRHADEGEDGEVGGEDGENGDLEARNSAEEPSHGSIREEMTT